MSRQLLYFLILINSGLMSQNNAFRDNVLALNMKFKQHKDSISNLYIITCGSVLDSSKIEMNHISKNKQDLINSYSPLGCWHRRFVKSYYLESDNSDSAVVIASFSEDKLIQVAIHLNGKQNILKYKDKLKKHFNLKEYKRKGSNKNQSYAFDCYDESKACLIISDKKVMGYLPLWCGNSRKRGNLKKLHKYLST